MKPRKLKQFTRRQRQLPPDLRFHRTTFCFHLSMRWLSFSRVITAEHSRLQQSHLRNLANEALLEFLDLSKPLTSWPGANWNLQSLVKLSNFLGKPGHLENSGNSGLGISLQTATLHENLFLREWSLSHSNISREQEKKRMHSRIQLKFNPLSISAKYLSDLQ